MNAAAKIGIRRRKREERNKEYKKKFGSGGIYAKSGKSFVNLSPCFRLTPKLPLKTNY